MEDLEKKDEDSLPGSRGGRPILKPAAPVRVNDADKG
jgi:hypothetical protein